MTSGKQVPAAAYVRMSTGEQTASPAQQREAIEHFAEKNGYQVTEWYSDLGVSGDKTEKRHAFKRMCADGIAGEYATIIAWDQSRIGRFDQLEAGYYFHPLRQAGIGIHTVQDGRIDLSTPEGRTIFGINSEAKHGYQRQLSADVSRGHAKKKAEGKWVTGIPPFGYVVGDNGKLVFDDPEKVAAVREIFARYAAGQSAREIVQWLDERGIKTIHGKHWSAYGIRMLLKNERYLGHAIYGQNDSSRFKNPSNPTGKTIRPPRDKWTIIPKAHPAIIKPDLFAEVQRRFEKNRTMTAPKSKNRYALSGLVRCGNCGASMQGTCPHGKRGYLCSNYQQHPGVCERREVMERELLRHVLRTIRVEVFEKVLDPKLLEAVKARMAEIVAETSKSGNAKRLRNQIKQLENKLERLTDRLCEVPQDMVSRVAEKIREAEDQRDELQQRLTHLTNDPKEQITDGEKRIEAAMGWLENLESLADMDDYDPTEINRLLTQYVTKVVVHIERVPEGKSGKRHKQRLTSGEVYFDSEALPYWAESAVQGWGDLPEDQPRATVAGNGRVVG